MGQALDANDPSLYLRQEDRETLIEYYETQNSAGRRIAIVLPWYNESLHRLGCTATSGQKAYIDAKGEVSPCVLLKASLGNIKSRRSKTYGASLRGTAATLYVNVSSGM